jgi:hypothetical protein
VSAAGILCLAVAAAFLGRERERRVAAAGLLILSLAFAAWRAGSPAGAGLMPVGELGQGFLVGNAGLLLVGCALICGGAFRAPPAPLRAVARLLTVGGIGLLAPVLLGFVSTGGLLRALAAAIGLGLTGYALSVGTRAIGGSPLAKIVARRLAPAPLAPVLRPGAGARRAFAVLVIAVATTVLASHALGVFAGVMFATWAGYLGFQPPGARPVPVAPVLTLLLVLAYWLLATIAGPMGLSLAVLPQIPLSPAAELLVEPALLLAAWAATGLWPLQRQLPGALTGLAGALLLARVARPLGPVALEYWRPLTAPILMLGLWHAAARSRWPLLLAGGGFLGVAAGTPDTVPASIGLLVAGLALELCGMGCQPRRAGVLVKAAAWPLVTLAGGFTLEGALRGQVVYTALGILGLALIVASSRCSAGTDASPAR